MSVPADQDRPARPARESDHRARRPRRLAFLHPLVSVRHGTRARCCGRRRRRQRISRLRRRHCRQFDRALAPGCRRRRRRAGAEVPAHVGDGLLLRAAGPARRGDEQPRAVEGAEEARSFPTRAPKRSKRQSSWRATRPGATASSRSSAAFMAGRSARCRSRRARRFSAKDLVRRSAVCITPRFPIRIAAWPDRAPRLLSTRRSATSRIRSSRISSRQTKSRRWSSSRFRAKVATSCRRLNFISACARLTQQARDAPRPRRGAVGDGPHGKDVCDRAFRRRARHRRRRQGHRVRTCRSA